MLNIKTVFVTILLPFISLKVLAIEPKTITKNHGLSHLNDKPSEKITIGIKPFFDPKMRKTIIATLLALIMVSCFKLIRWIRCSRTKCGY